MEFRRIEPSPSLKEYVECYWIVTSRSQSPIIQKIIPDGFPEVIFHFGDAYQIDLSGQWKIQSNDLLAGQITRYFHLKNQGSSDIFGIKFRPSAIRRIFGLDMSAIVDQVISIKESTSSLLQEFAAVIRNQSDHTNRVKACEEFLQKTLQTPAREIFPTELLDTIISKNGIITIAELCKLSHISERTVERLFKKFIGVSPKFYSRIIRFSYIFSVVNNKTLSWSEIGLESGYYDQPHFIKNFKSFTGEEPARYFFEEETLANFFLKKTVP